MILGMLCRALVYLDCGKGRRSEPNHLWDVADITQPQELAPG